MRVAGWICACSQHQISANDALAQDRCSCCKLVDSCACFSDDRRDQPLLLTFCLHTVLQLLQCHRQSASCSRDDIVERTNSLVQSLQLDRLSVSHHHYIFEDWMLIPLIWSGRFRFEVVVWPHTEARTDFCWHLDVEIKRVLVLDITQNLPKFGQEMWLDFRSVI